MGNGRSPRRRAVASSEVARLVGHTWPKGTAGLSTGMPCWAAGRGLWRLRSCRRRPSCSRFWALAALGAVRRQKGLEWEETTSAQSYLPDDSSRADSGVQQ